MAPDQPSDHPRCKKDGEAQACRKPDQAPAAPRPLPGMDGPEQGFEGFPGVKPERISDLQNLPAVGINPDGRQGVAVVGF